MYIHIFFVYTTLSLSIYIYTYIYIYISKYTSIHTLCTLSRPLSPRPSDPFEQRTFEQRITGLINLGSSGNCTYNYL